MRKKVISLAAAIRGYCLLPAHGRFTAYKRMRVHPYRHYRPSAGRRKEDYGCLKHRDLSRECGMAGICRAGSGVKPDDAIGRAGDACGLQPVSIDGRGAARNMAFARN